jgi:hypothetical protein
MSSLLDDIISDGMTPDQIARTDFLLKLALVGTDSLGTGRSVRFVIADSMAEYHARTVVDEARLGAHADSAARAHLDSATASLAAKAADDAVLHVAAASRRLADANVHFQNAARNASAGAENRKGAGPGLDDQAEAFARRAELLSKLISNETQAAKTLTELAAAPTLATGVDSAKKLLAMAATRVASATEAIQVVNVIQAGEPKSNPPQQQAPSARKAVLAPFSRRIPEPVDTTCATAIASTDGANATVAANAESNPSNGKKGESKKDNHGRRSIRALDESQVALIGELLATGETDEVRKNNLDQLARTARLVVIEREITSVVFPVRSTDQALVFWRQAGGASPLNLGSVTAAGGLAASMTEIAAPILSGVRIAFSAVVSKKDDKKSDGTPNSADTKSNALTQFLSTGGQFNINATWPMAGYRDKAKEFAALLLLNCRFGGTTGTLGTVSEDPSAYIDPGVELHVGWEDALQGIGFFVQPRWGWPTVGPNLKTAMDMPSNFRYGTVTAGFTFQGRYLLSAGRAFGSPTLNRTKIQFGVTVLGAAQ